MNITEAHKAVLENTQEGVYVVRRDIEHDNIDKRVKNDWRRMKIHAGTRMVFKREQNYMGMDIDVYTIHPERGYSWSAIHHKEPLFWDLLDEMECADENLSTLIGENSQYTMMLALATAIDEGKIQFHAFQNILKRINDSDNESYVYFKEIARKHCL